MKIAISSGHGQKIQGASAIINEVTEARRVVSAVTKDLRERKATVVEFHDNTSTTQATNINTIVAWHNAQTRDLDVSIHFNHSGGGTVDRAIGTECLFATQQALAARVSKAIAQSAGLLDRGAKKRTDLAFLSRTTKPAILVEVCFVNSREDVRLYQAYFNNICTAIGGAIMGASTPSVPRPPEGGAATEGGANLEHMTKIGSVDIQRAYNGGYIRFVSILDVCNDGVGPKRPEDPHQQAQTTYRPFLNADLDKYIVIPNKVRLAVKPTVIGCMGRITHLPTRQWSWAVTGTTGPDNKTGEASHILAKLVFPNARPDFGDKKADYFYEFWPGIPAVVDGKQYQLVPA